MFQEEDGRTDVDGADERAVAFAEYTHARNERE